MSCISAILSAQVAESQAGEQAAEGLHSKSGKIGVGGISQGSGNIPPPAQTPWEKESELGWWRH